MEFIEINNEIRIIPENIKDSVTGIVKKSENSFISVMIEDVNTEIKEGSSVEIVVSKDNHLLRCDAEIESKDGAMIFLSKIKNLRIVQRREFPRVDMQIPVNLSEIDTPEKVISSITKNIGGGGMQLSLSDEFFSEGKVLNVKFNISTGRIVDTSIEVLRTEKSSAEYSLSGKFKNISSIDKTAIIQMCFKRQIELKCKGINNK